MTAVGSLDRSFASAQATAAPSPLHVPRVPPLDERLGAVSFFARLLHNPLRILPVAAYEEDIVWAERAGRLIAWITEPGLIKTVLLEKREVFERTAVTQRLLGPYIRYPTFDGDEELLLYLCTGVDDSMCALRAATVTPATLLGITAAVGTIEVGKLANLVVVTGNDLFAAGNPIKHVFVEGRLY